MIDRTDARLLAELQRNSSITAQDLGDLLGLSPSQAARRRQKLESDKVIVGYRAEIAPEKVGLGVQVFIEVQMAAHTPEAAKSFASLVATLREVVGCWTLTGTSDYLLRVWCADLAALNFLVQDRLLPHPVVARLESKIVMGQLKADIGVPVP